MSTPRTSLFPGYKHVTEFSSNPDEYESDSEEVSYVTLDLGGVEPTLVPSSSTYRLIGLDTPTPFLQLSGTVFKGQHVTLIGDELLFQDSQNDTNKASRHVSYLASTESRVQFKEVKLVPKNNVHEQEQQVYAPIRAENSKGKGKAPIAGDGSIPFVDMITGSAVGSSNQVDPQTGKKQRGGRRKKATGMNPVQENRRRTVAEEVGIANANKDVFGREQSSSPSSQQDMVLVKDLPAGDDVLSGLNEAGMSMDTS